MNHLGGHFGGTAMTIPIFDFLKNKFDVKSVIDIGCGPAGMTQYINYRGVYCVGIDGDISIGKRDYVIFHDYITGPLELNETFDLAYSTEFLEHVEEKYFSNYIESFKKAKYVFCTAAYPGQGGHHHVNEQHPEYWIKRFKEEGFEFDEQTRNELRLTSNDKSINRNSLFFKNTSTIKEPTVRKPFEIDYEKLKFQVNRHHDICGRDVVGYDRW
jgi:SAM-dependent methyltransferase